MYTWRRGDQETGREERQEKGRRIGSEEREKWAEGEGMGRIKVTSLALYFNLHNVIS